MSYPEANPGRFGYLLSRLLGLLGLILFLAGIVLGINLFLAKPTAGSLKEIRVPGKTVIELEKPGAYNLYHNWMWSETPRSIQIKIKSEQGGEEIGIRDLSANPESSWREPDRYKKFGELTVNEPGRYEVTTSYEAGGRLSPSIYLGLSYNPDIRLPLAASIGGIVLIILGLIIASAVFKARTRAAEALGDKPIYKEKGICVYPRVIFLKKKFSATEIHQSQINYVQQIIEFVKGRETHTLQGIKINYTDAGRERERVFWSNSYSKLYHAIKAAGYRTRWEPPKVSN